MAISDDWTVDYANRRIYHNPAGTVVYSVNELYSYLMNVFDESGTIDDTIPMTAQTPTSYTLTNGWFINYADDTDATEDSPYPSYHFLKGGSIKTSGWDGATSANGIRVLYFQASGYVEAVASDIGKVVTDGTDTGRLLDFDNTAMKWWVRQDGSDDNFPSGGSVTITTGTGTGTLSQNSPTGENIWSNPFTLGTIEPETNLYLIQNNTAITSWWSTGHIDILTLVKEAGTEIDSGLITFFARQYSKLYDHYVADLTDGSRTPIPLATNPDVNNTTGYALLECSGGTVDFTDGEVVGNNAVRGSATALAIITNVAGTTTDPDLTIYYIGDLTAFTNSDTITGYTSTATADVDTVTTAGPAAGTNATITVTFGHYLHDLNNGNNDRPYSVRIDCQQVPIAQVYERLKYLTRQGAAGDIDNGSQTITGQSYIGIGDYLVAYDGQTTPFVEGETINGATSGATGIVTSDYDEGATGNLVLRNVRGTFLDDENLRSGLTVRAVANIPSGAEVITPAKQSPFGTFAGGKFFGARGVLVLDVPTADSTNYELIDTLGEPQTPPNIVGVEVTGVTRYTQCYVVDTTPTVYLNDDADTQVSGNYYKATANHTYTIDIPVTVRAREMGYLPFETSGTIGSSGLSIAAVWLVDPNWKFVVTGVNITFNENGGSADTIVRAAGNFENDGWVAVLSQVTVEGSGSNDGTYIIDSISTNTLTLNVSEDLVQEGPVSGVTLTFTRRGLT